MMLTSSAFDLQATSQRRGFAHFWRCLWGPELTTDLEELPDEDDPRPPGGYGPLSGSNFSSYGECHSWPDLEPMPS